jgi:hypothetical protein
MPVATTTEAGRQVLTPAAEKILNDRERRRQASDRAAAALNAPQDAPLFAEPTVAPTKPSATFTIHALMDDFPFDVQFCGTADQFKATVQRLRDLGAVPPTQAARAAVEAEKERSAPVCQYHGTMKESSKAPGTWYCSAKMGDGTYCKSKG